MTISKVALFCDFLNSVGGTEYYNTTLAIELKKCGIDVRVFIGEKTKLTHWTNILSKYNIPYYEPTRQHSVLSSRQIETIFIRNRVISILDKWQPDVIHCSPAGKMLLAFLETKQKNSIPIIATEYTTPSPTTAHWYQKDLPNKVNKINAFIATCKASARGIRNFHGYKGHIKVIRHLISHKQTQDKFIYNQSVACIARLSPEKGVGFLLGAWKIVASKCPKATLHIYGHGYAEEYLRELTKSLGIEKSVLFHGIYPPEKGISSIVKKHQIFIQPSMFESISTSTIELMGYAKPIIATNAGGTKEIINKKTGILIPVASTDILAKKIITLLREPTLCEYYGRNAKQYFMTEYDLKNNIEKTIDLYKKVIRK